jgi:uncharacterized protein YqeY
MMSLIEQINQDFMIAYKAKEMQKKDFLGVLKTEVTKETKIPEDTYIVSKIKSMIKNAAATNSLTEDELSILNKYLPAQMDEETLTQIINEQVINNGYSDIKDMGKIMGYLKNNYDGQYDGSLVSKLIKEILTNK